jgi:hypothetical protein
VDWDTAQAAFSTYLKVERNYSPRTIDAYTRDVAALRAYLLAKRGKETPLARLSAIEVRSLLAGLFGVNSATSIGRKLSSVRAFCRFLVKRGVLAGNPADAIRGPKKPKSLPRALDGDDAAVRRRDDGVLIVRHGTRRIAKKLQHESRDDPQRQRPCESRIGVHRDGGDDRGRQIGPPFAGDDGMRIALHARSGRAAFVPEAARPHRCALVGH